MARKTGASLSVVSLATLRQPKPPAGLGSAGLQVWRSILAEYDVSDAEGLIVLGLAAQAADRAADCKAAIDREA
jgi:hypothetical protein